MPILRGRVDALPSRLSALLVASDLQGVAPSSTAGGALVLLGQVLAERLGALADEGLLPPPGQLGVLLCGDLYAAPAGDVRGATGDVRAVWRAFAAHARFVVGVAGNHDLFGPAQEVERTWARPGRERVDRGAARSTLRRFAAEPGMHLLDGQVVELDDLRVGGVGGIIGNTRKPNRRECSDYLELLGQVLERQPDILVVHEGPDDPATGRRGNPEIRDFIEGTTTNLLVLCGHCHWPAPLAILAGGNQVLNADARAILLHAA